MPRVTRVQRAFISYATPDRTFAEKLAGDLRNKGIEVWLDFEGLEPGTPDWESELRTAIGDSFALLLIASPDSRRSPYVRSELLLASAGGLPIYALWAAGTDWIESVPMSHAHMQYQDFRGDAYADSLRVLLQKLANFGTSLPDHFVYESFYTKVPIGGPGPKRGVRWGSCVDYSVFSKQRPHGYVEIQTLDPWVELEHGDAVDTIFIRASAYESGTHLIDELFVNYLHDRYPAFSYGQKWYLRQRHFAAARVAIDWEILHRQEPAEPEEMMILRFSPETYGFSPGRAWQVFDGMPAYTYVLGAYENELIDGIVRRAKASGTLMRIYMSEVSAEEFTEAELPIVAVVTSLWPSRRARESKILMQHTDLSPEMMRRWYL